MGHQDPHIYTIPYCNMPKRRERVAEFINRTERRAGRGSPRIRPEDVRQVRYGTDGSELAYHAQREGGRVFIIEPAP